MTPLSRDDLYRLLDALCDDRIDDAGFAHLQEAVLSDEAARVLYVEYVTLHGLLHFDAVEGTSVTRETADLLESATRAIAQPAEMPAARRRRRWLPLTTAACALLATALLFLNRGRAPGVVQHGDPEVNPSGADSVHSPADAAASDEPPPAPLQLPRGSVPSEVLVDAANGSEPDSPAPASRAHIVDYINEQLALKWADAGVEPSPQADDAEWVRRVHLDLAGRIPTVRAVRSFLADRAVNKRQVLIDRLLDEPTFAGHFATTWTNLLVGRAAERDIDRDALAKFLREQFWRNAPWTDTVTQLVAAEGSEHENGAANFLLAHLNNQAVPATAITARIFLCEQVQCSQCHIHPIVKDWGQEQFWELNAFFSQTDIVEKLQTGPDGQSRMERRLVSKPVGGETYYETLNGVMRVAYPKFNGQEIDNDAALNRRLELARLMSEGDRPQMAAAFVNRLWAQLFGRGFTTPLDDMGPHNPASHPEILAAVTEEFVKSGYDVKQLVRWLCQSELYQMSSRRIPGNAADTAEEGSPPLFSRMYLKPLTAEQLFDSLIASTHADQAGVETWTDAAARRKTWLAQFYSVLENEENSDSSTFDGSVPQALVMMNGELVREATSARPGTFLHSVLNSKGADVEKLRQLCQSTLSREPTSQEIAAFRQIVRQNARARGESPGSVQLAMNEGLSDAYWAFLNSAEFLVNH